MFEQETPLTKRINELAKKAKTVGLTEAEKEEQTLLRQEFLIKFRANFKTQLDNIEIVDEDEKEKEYDKGYGNGYGADNAGRHNSICERHSGRGNQGRVGNRRGHKAG